MISVKAKVAEPQKARLSLTIEMEVREWEGLADQLRATTRYPAGAIASKIQVVLGRLFATVKEEIDPDIVEAEARSAP